MISYKKNSSFKIVGAIKNFFEKPNPSKRFPWETLSTVTPDPLYNSRWNLLFSSTLEIIVLYLDKKWNKKWETRYNF